jgi:hypothetical protein
MRIHPVSLALQYLKGRRRIRAAPYYGASPFRDVRSAIRVLKLFTGQDFGTDTRKWSNWLRRNQADLYNRWVRPRSRASQAKPDASKGES